MDLQGKVVAIVDDDLAVRDSTQVLLELHGIDVRTHPGGKDFLKAAPNIACLIVDYHMPGMNGLELVAELGRRGFKGLVILITAFIDPTIERRAAELGIRRVLSKPLATRMLLAALREELR